MSRLVWLECGCVLDPRYRHVGKEHWCPFHASWQYVVPEKEMA